MLKIDHEKILNVVYRQIFMNCSEWPYMTIFLVHGQNISTLKNFLFFTPLYFVYSNNNHRERFGFRKRRYSRNQIY